MANDKLSPETPLHVANVCGCCSWEVDVSDTRVTVVKMLIKKSEKWTTYNIGHVSLLG